MLVAIHQNFPSFFELWLFPSESDAKVDNKETSSEAEESLKIVKIGLS